MKKLVKGYNSMTASNSPLFLSLHAEISACKRLARIATKLKLRMSRADLIVLRVSRDGKMGSSRPCYHCIKQLDKYTRMLNFKLRYVYYSNSDGKIIREKFYDLLNSDVKHFSRGSR